MAAIHGKNTKPELIVRKWLWSHGYRYRLNHPRLPGKPDIVLRKYKTCIFVNGCFWHGHEGCKYYRTPKTNTDFWINKVRRNKESMLGYRLKKDRNINFLDYYQAYIDTYSKKDLRMVKIDLNRFKDFLKEQYPVYEFSIKPELITKDMMEHFVEYLNSRSLGEGAQSIYQRFKKVVRYASITK